MPTTMTVPMLKRAESTTRCRKGKGNRGPTVVKQWQRGVKYWSDLHMLSWAECQHRPAVANRRSKNGPRNGQGRVRRGHEMVTLVRSSASIRVNSRMTRIGHWRRHRRRLQKVEQSYKAHNQRRWNRWHHRRRQKVEQSHRVHNQRQMVNKATVSKTRCRQ